MSSGVGLFEVIIVLTISVAILSIAINSVSESSAVTKKLTTNQQKLEAIFFAVDMIKSDLTRCGMRLQEVQKVSDTGWFQRTTRGFTVVYGIFGDTAASELFTGDSNISINRSGFFKKNKEIVLFNLEHESFESNCIKDAKKDYLTLLSPVKNDYYHPFMVVVLKRVEYKFDPKKKILSRKVDRGHFQPLLRMYLIFLFTIMKNPVPCCIGLR